MSNYCVFCKHRDNINTNADKEGLCDLSGMMVAAFGTCPGWEPRDLPDVKAVLNKAGPVEQAKPKLVSKPKQSRAKSVTEIELDRDNTVTLYEHQKIAREKFKDKNEIALFFEMGCGKTLTSMMIVCDKYKAGQIDSLLVVAPNDVHKQWFDDLCNEESTLSQAIEQEGVSCVGQIIGGRGGQKVFYDFDDEDKKLHIVCVNIDTFSQPHKWEPVVEWANAHNTAIIIDEATVIKNPSSKRSQRMLYEFNDVMKKRNTILFSGKKPNTQVRIVLTGTPVTNGPMDLWSIMEFIKPNYFNRNYYSFMNYYGMHTKLTVQNRTISVLLTEKTWQGIKRCEDYTTAYETFGCSEDTYLTIKHQDKYLGPYKHAEELKVLLEPNAVFAKLVDCVDMPACNYLVKEIPLSDAQQVAYNSMKRDLLAQYDDHITEAKNQMVVTLRLQQISSGFIMGHKDNAEELDIPCWAEPDTFENYDVTPDEVVWLGDTNPKLEQLMRDVDELDKPLLIMTRFSAEAAKIYDLLKDKYSVCLYTGWKTIGSIAEFKEGKYDIIVANITKISRGHNLQCAHTTLYYSNTYSMEHRQQSEFRTFRIGQKHPCTYVDYVSSPVDKMVLDALKLKKGLLEYIRDKDIKEVI